MAYKPPKQTIIDDDLKGIPSNEAVFEALKTKADTDLSNLNSTAVNAPINMGSNEISNTNYVLSPKLHDNQTKTAAFTIDFTNAPCQQVTINNAGPLTITLDNPVTGGVYLIEIIQGATPGTVTWPASVKWGEAGAPTLSTVSGKIDIINLYYNGTNYLGTYALGF
jgi:hypothetical protein